MLEQHERKLERVGDGEHKLLERQRTLKTI